MGSKGLSRIPRKWFSNGLGIVFGHFLTHLGTRLKRKSTVAEQRGCALDSGKCSHTRGDCFQAIQKLPPQIWCTNQQTSWFYCKARLPTFSLVFSRWETIGSCGSCLAFFPAFPPLCILLLSAVPFFLPFSFCFFSYQRNLLTEPINAKEDVLCRSVSRNEIESAVFRPYETLFFDKKKSLRHHFLSKTLVKTWFFIFFQNISENNPK